MEPSSWLHVHTWHHLRSQPALWLPTIEILRFKPKRHKLIMMTERSLISVYCIGSLQLNRRKIAGWIWSLWGFRLGEHPTYCNRMWRRSCSTCTRSYPTWDYIRVLEVHPWQQGCNFSEQRGIEGRSDRGTFTPLPSALPNDAGN